MIKKGDSCKIVYIVCVFGHIHIQTLECIPKKWQSHWKKDKPILYKPYSLELLTY